MLCPHLASQAAFYDVQTIRCKHDDPLYSTSYPRVLRPERVCDAPRGPKPVKPPWFVLRAPRYVLAVTGRSDGTISRKCPWVAAFVTYCEVAAFQALLQIQSSGTLTPHMEQVHTSQGRVIYDRWRTEGGTRRAATGKTVDSECGQRHHAEPAQKGPGFNLAPAPVRHVPAGAEAQV